MAAMTAKPALWRPMTEADLPQVGMLAAAIHPDFPEDDAVFAERLRLYPAGCHVLARGEALAAYVVSHPWIDRQPPALNDLLGVLPDRPSTYYIHDLALAPAARGSGAGGKIVAQLAALARSEALPTMSLVAVNGSERFWQRQGFAPVAVPELEAKLRSYSAAARFMVRVLQA
jgi:ribosomal protein S18 acetylase RimI-like enzyme